MARVPAEAPVTVVIPTYNEEANLPRCLDSCAGWSHEIIVIDSYSTDRTIEIAQGVTDKVLQHEYEHAPQQWKWILEEAPISTEWVLALDADYVVTEQLRKEIIDAIRRDEAFDGYYVPHRQMFRGRFIKHGGMYPRHRLNLFRRTKVLIDDRDLVDNRFYVTGRTRKLTGDLVEDNAKEYSFSVWMRKQIAYAERAAREEIARRSDNPPPPGALLRGRNRRVLWLKHRWLRLPLYWRSIGYFIYRYVFRLGFLDGREGFLYHLSQGLAFRVMLDARIEELADAE